MDMTNGSTLVGGHITLDDGSEITLREATDDDAPALEAMAARLSPMTYWRYFHVGGSYNAAWAGRVAELGHRDGPGTYALVAVSHDSLVGVARYVQDAPAVDGDCSASIGILLADDWQGRHLGRHVLRELAMEARRQGLSRLTGHALWENTRMLRLARRLFPDARIVHYDGPECRMTLSLDDLVAAA